MYKYLKDIFQNIQVYSYNYFHNKPQNNYPNKSIELNYDIAYRDDEKQLKIDTLLTIKHYKNLYYKYTDKTKFNHELYNNYISNDNFDEGETAYDDDDKNIKIFDKYILQYIKNRNDLISHLQGLNKEIIIKTSLDNIFNYKKKCNEIDAVFVIDMNEKDLFLYIYSFVKEQKTLTIIQNIIFSLIIKYQNQFIKIKIDNFPKNKENHPYIILDAIL